MGVGVVSKKEIRENNQTSKVERREPLGRVTDAEVLKCLLFIVHIKRRTLQSKVMNMAVRNLC